MKYPENRKYQDSHQEPKQNLTRSLKFRILDDPSKNSLGMNRIKTRASLIFRKTGIERPFSSNYINCEHLNIL